MGHTRLGAIAKTRKWLDLVEHMTSSTAGTPAAAGEIDAIAARALEAAQKALERATNDPGVGYAFYVLTQIALASRASDWDAALSELGIRLPEGSTLFDLTAEAQDAIDRYLIGESAKSTDLAEIAQQAAGEAVASLAGPQVATLFGTSSSDLQSAIRSLSTKKGFGELGQRFFGRFMARFLNFYLSRITAATFGSARLQQLGDLSRFNEALKLHCDQSARIVRDFCGEWYSKTEYLQGIDLENCSRFMAVALQKLRKELRQQRTEA